MRRNSKPILYIWLVFFLQTFLLYLCTILSNNPPNHTYRDVKKHYVSDKYVMSQGFSPVIVSSLLGTISKKNDLEKELERGEFIYEKAHCSNLEYIKGRFNKFYYCPEKNIDRDAENKLIYVIGGKRDSLFLNNLKRHGATNLNSTSIMLEVLLREGILSLKNFIDAKKDNSRIEILKYDLQGFPEAWDGDKYQELPCPSKDIPKFLDGYFLCQISAAYGNAKAPPGQRLNHMIDAIGAVGAFHISNGEVVFSAQYYPARPYKIWEFYDRNMTKASVPWAGWSDYNLSAMAKWEQIPNNADSARFHPNLDFWRVGKKLIAGTEAPYWVGYEFNVRSLNKFKLFPFTEDNEIFGNPRPNMIPISMGIHERTDASGNIWGSFSAMNFDEKRFYQGIFTVDSSGVRRVVGIYDYGVWDEDACSKNDEYIGDKAQLPGYIHSITSTENYIILPVTSLLINPCKFKEPPLSNPHSSIQNGGLWGMDFYEQVPVRFLIFNKKTWSWITQKPLEVFPSMFITHQLNAYENLEGNLIADMIVYDSHDPYVKYFYTDFLTSQVYPSTARVLRFTLDIQDFKVMYSYLIPQETIAADFPQINHAFDGQAYQWGYLVEHPFAADNSILKINMDDPAGGKNLRFKADSSYVLHEPWVVSRPNSVGEDDAVLIIRALDLAENKGVLIIVDASTMLEVGRANVPISIPFGFHNRFFSSRDLGLYSKLVEESSSTNGFSGNNLDRSSAVVGHRGEWIYKNRKPHSWKPLVQPPPSSTTSSAFWSRMLITTAPSPTWLPIRPVATSSNNMHWWKTTTLSEASPQPTLPPYILRPPPHSRPYSSRLVHPHPTSVAEIEKYAMVRERTNQVGDTPTVRRLYDKILKSLCNWLSKIFKNVTFDGCFESGHKAVKWMSPIAAEQLNLVAVDEGREEQTSLVNEHSETLEQELEKPAEEPPVSMFRAMLKPKIQLTPSPWYNYRTYTRVTTRPAT